jgi:Bacterial capsule synthesis protein PGA_cap
VIDVRGTRVAVLGATDVPDLTAAARPVGPASPGVASARDPDRLIRAVSAAAESADVVVVYLHYGEERVGCPLTNSESSRRHCRQPAPTLWSAPTRMSCSAPGSWVALRVLRPGKLRLVHPELDCRGD